VSISFETRLNDEYAINFYNTIGKVVLSEKVEVNGKYSQTFDLSNLASGVYFVEIKNDQGKTTQRLVLNK
jgi:hypothetical protein